MEPTYQQITDIFRNRIGKVVDEIRESDLSDEYRFSKLCTRMDELTQTLNEITTLKESLNTETPKNNP